MGKRNAARVPDKQSRTEARAGETRKVSLRDMSRQYSNESGLLGLGLDKTVVMLVPESDLGRRDDTHRRHLDDQWPPEA